MGLAEKSSVRMGGPGAGDGSIFVVVEEEEEEEGGGTFC